MQIRLGQLEYFRSAALSRAWTLRLALALALTLGLLAPCIARAHPDLDAAITRAEEADFESALNAFAAAVESRTLSRDELIRLLAERAIVLHALGRHDEVTRDLQYLALLAPTHQLGKSAPPKLVARFDEVRAAQPGPLALDAHCSPSATGVRVDAAARNAGAARAELFLHTQIGAQGWVETRASELTLAESGSRVSYFAELRGEGGVPLATSGSAAAPLRCEGAEAGSDPTEPAQAHARRKWWWIGGAGVAAVAVATVAVVLVTRDRDPSQDTQISQPMVSF